MVRNKAKHFPGNIPVAGEPRAKAQYTSTRANGTINTIPRERMLKSNQNRIDDDDE